MADDGFHEIQLNSKQLIFICMTAALVLVVAFLSGVLVGRGVRSEKDLSPIADAVTTAVAAPADVPGNTPPPAVQAAPPAAVAPPTPADEDLTYEKRLEGKQAPKETIQPMTAPPPSAAPGKGAAKETAKEAAKAAAPAVPPARDAAATKTSAPADAAKPKVEAPVYQEPSGSGYYLKIVALRDKGQAEALAKRLTGKGYNTYVVSASGGLHSVRVGKYKTRKEADSTRRRLEKEEQLKPLISH